jgi:hypothetical protein
MKSTISIYMSKITIKICKALTQHWNVGLNSVYRGLVVYQSVSP